MRSLVTTLLLGFVLFACSGDPVGDEQGDAMIEPGPPDAGDAGFEPLPVDAGDDPIPDAGEEQPGVDAGEPDAGEDQPSPDAGEPPPTGLAPGVRVRHVALFQGVKVPLATDGVASPSQPTPVVSGREAVVRAWVEGTLSTQVGLLDVSTGAELVTLEASVPEVFPDVPGLQALTFQVPASLVQPEARYRVRITTRTGGEHVSPGVLHDARYPADGSDAPLRAQADPGPLKVVLVPVQYDTDGSHRLPDTSPEQLERMRSLLHALYPATEVELTVREPMRWNVGLRWPSGNVNFNTLNIRLAGLRVSDGAPFDAYYYGLISPASTFGAYCGRSCVTGQSYVVDDVTDADERLGSGMGFSGDDSVWTLVHELGHQHGRKHAPCNTSGDNDYPHSNARLGAWGYDATTGTLVDPEATRDFMSYCDPTWVSDYTWKALYERIAAVNALAFRATPVRIATFAVVVEEGEASAAQRLPALSSQIGAPGVEVALLASDGAVVDRVTSRVVAHSHGGVTLFVPAPPTAVEALAFTFDGVTHQVPVVP